MNFLLQYQVYTNTNFQKETSTVGRNLNRRDGSQGAYTRRMSRICRSKHVIGPLEQLEVSWRVRGSAQRNRVAKEFKSAILSKNRPF